MTLIEKVSALAYRVEESKLRLEEAIRGVEAARREETDRLNAYNEVCKEFDEAVAELQSQAPRQTDWGRVGRGEVAGRG